MKVYPSDASAPRSSSRRLLKYHVSEQNGSTGHRTYTAACDTSLILDENSGSDHTAVHASYLCRRRACQRALGVQMHPHPGQWVTGTTIVTERRVTGRAMRSGPNHEGRDVVIVSDEEQPHLRAPFHVYADTITVHGKRPQ